MDKDIEYLRVQQLIENEDYDKAYTCMKELGESNINIISISRHFKDNILWDYIEKDPCDDNRYNIVRTGDSNSSSGGGSGNCCCDIICMCVVPYNFYSWCINNPESCAEKGINCCECGCKCCTCCF